MAKNKSENDWLNVSKKERIETAIEIYEDDDDLPDGAAMAMMAEFAGDDVDEMDIVLGMAGQLDEDDED